MSVHCPRHLRVSVVCVLSAACIAVALSVPGKCSANNVLLLIADDYGVDSMGLYTGGSQDVAPTPNLDALAANGVLFTNFWANPICSPTRAAMLTGRHGFRTGVGSPQGNNTIPVTEYTLADVMNSQGYHTANFGKWHLGNGDSGPNLLGWDHFEGITGGGVQNYYSWRKNTNGAVQNNFANYTTTEMVDNARDWINDKGADPWFCWLAFNAPHTPFHVPPSDLQTQNVTNNSTNLQKYKAAVEALDTEIGRLLSEIGSGVLAETTVIFIGDNGTPGQVANNFERGNKGQLYQGGVHTPAIVTGKAVAAPLNRTCDALVHVSDLFATIAELGGYDTTTDLPAGVFIDSLSAAPYLADANLPSIHDKAFAERFAATPAAQDGKTIRNEQYKYIRFDNGSEQFFDLAATGGEANNNDLLNSNDPEHVANLAELRTCMDDVLASPVAAVQSVVVEDENDPQRSTVRSITVNFYGDVSAPESAFTLTNTGKLNNPSSTEVTTLNVDREVIGQQTVATITFDSGVSVVDRQLGNSLADGNYQLDIDGEQITGDAAEQDYVLGDVADDDLFRLYGDDNGDGFVDVNDLFDGFSQAFNSDMNSPNYVEHLDANGDGFIDVTDLFDYFAPNFNSER